MHATDSRTSSGSRWWQTNTKLRHDRATALAKKDTATLSSATLVTACERRDEERDREWRGELQQITRLQTTRETCNLGNRPTVCPCVSILLLSRCRSACSAFLALFLLLQCCRLQLLLLSAVSSDPFFSLARSLADNNCHVMEITGTPTRGPFPVTPFTLHLGSQFRDQRDEVPLSLSPLLSMAPLRQQEWHRDVWCERVAERSVGRT